MLSAQPYVAEPQGTCSDLNSFLNSILPVVIVYEQSAAEVVKRLRPVFPFTIFVYDNSKRRDEPLDGYTIYIHDGQNHGVSPGYNKAFAEAIKRRKKWLLLLDQDTQLNMDYLANAFRETTTQTNTKVFAPILVDQKGCVSPFFWKPPRGKRIRATPGRYDLENFRFANSGVLISCEAFQQANGYDESLPLDFSDIDFGDRLRMITNHFFVVDVKIEHEFSAGRTYSLQDALARFHQFYKAALVMGRKWGNGYKYWTYAFMRALRLCTTYRSLSFLTLFFKRPK